MVHEVEDQMAKKQRIIDEQAETIDQLKQESQMKSYELQKTKEDAKRQIAEAKNSQEESARRQLAEQRRAQEEATKKQLSEMKKAEEEARKAAEEFRRKNEELERAREKVRNASAETDRKQAVASDIMVSSLL